MAWKECATGEMSIGERAYKPYKGNKSRQKETAVMRLVTEIRVREDKDRDSEWDEDQSCHLWQTENPWVLRIDLAVG